MGKQLVLFKDIPFVDEVEEFNLLMNKQVAVDSFIGLGDITDIMNVFLGVNTVRIELNEIDLIRSYNSSIDAI